MHGRHGSVLELPRCHALPNTKPALAKCAGATPARRAGGNPLLEVRCNPQHYAGEQPFDYGNHEGYVKKEGRHMLNSHLGHIAEQRNQFNVPSRVGTQSLYQ